MPSCLAHNQLDTSWLSIKAANNLPILADDVTWVKIQINDQLVDCVEVVVTLGPRSSAVPIVLGMNILKDLDLPCLLPKFKHSGRRAGAVVSNLCGST